MTMDEEARTLVRQLVDELRPLTHQLGTPEENERFATSADPAWAAKRRVMTLRATAEAALADTGAAVASPAA